MIRHDTARLNERLYEYLPGDAISRLSARTSNVTAAPWMLYLKSSIFQVVTIGKLEICNFGGGL